MIDPHVEKLQYKIVPKDHVDYDKAESFEVETDSFTMILGARQAVFLMKDHFTTEQEALSVVNEYIKQWEVIIGLEHGPDEFKLVFESSNIIDRAPASDDKNNLRALKGSIRVSVGLDAELHLSHSKFPTLPKEFALSPDVETMYVMTCPTSL